MAIYYVGSAGNNTSNGTTWATRYLTMAKAGSVVAPGDTVYVGPGAYREAVVLTTAGTAGPGSISWVGDYGGANTDGVGGIVRMTASPDDLTYSRTSIIVGTSVNYNTFSGFGFEMCNGTSIKLENCTNFTVDKCYFVAGSNVGGYILGTGASQANITVQNCYFSDNYQNNQQAASVQFQHTGTLPNPNHLVQNCIFMGGGLSASTAIVLSKVPAGTIKNNLFRAIGGTAIVTTNAIGGGAVPTIINNNIFTNCTGALNATAITDMTEDYNTFWGLATTRTNVSVGANSVTILPLFDFRWFFEATK